MTINASSTPPAPAIYSGLNEEWFCFSCAQLKFGSQLEHYLAQADRQGRFFISKIGWLTRVDQPQTHRCRACQGHVN